MSRSLLPMLLFHQVCHSCKIYLLIDGLKLENGILKEVGSNESDVFACLSTMAKKQAKKRHIENSDTDSENSYPASQPTKSSSSTSTKKPYVPRFLIIHSEKEGETISSLSPFVVHKTIMSIAGELKSIKNLRSGDLLIQCAKKAYEKKIYYR